MAALQKLQRRPCAFHSTNAAFMYARNMIDCVLFNVPINVISIIRKHQHNYIAAEGWEDLTLCSAFIGRDLHRPHLLRHRASVFVVSSEELSEYLF